MVRDHRGREWSVATKDCPNFLTQISVNPKIQKSSIFKSYLTKTSRFY